MTEGTKASIISGCSKRPSSKAAVSEVARRTLRYVEPLSDARTPLAVFFSILLEIPRCVMRTENQHFASDADQFN
jgi:hypothetical protein